MMTVKHAKNRPWITSRTTDEEKQARPTRTRTIAILKRDIEKKNTCPERKENDEKNTLSSHLAGHRLEDALDGLGVKHRHDGLLFPD